MNSPKFVQLEPSAFLTDVDFMAMGATQRGIYCTLIFLLYCNGGKLKFNNPPSGNTIGVLCGEGDVRCRNDTFESDVEIVLKKFEFDGKYLTHKRVSAELQKVADFQQFGQVGGMRSARLREARQKGTHTEAEWLSLVQVANGICPRCQKQTNHFDKDHVISVYQGGSDSIGNIQPLCAKCNASKGPEMIDFFVSQRKIAIPTLSATPLDSLLQVSKVKVSKVNISKDKVKIKHLDFVFLSEDEYKKLTDRFGEPLLKEKIAALNDAIGSKGYKYKSHYFTILNWDRRAGGGVKVSPKSERPKLCFVCKKPTALEILTGTAGRGKHYICIDCNNLLAEAPPFKNFRGMIISRSRLELGQLEKIILDQKAKR